MKNQISHGATSAVPEAAHQHESGADLKSSYQSRRSGQSRTGKIKSSILLWALGVPIPFILLFLLIRGCTG